MVFNSLTFLFFFLPLTLAATFLSAPKWQNTILLFASVLFFAWGAPKFIFILVTSCFIDYFLSLRISNALHNKHDSHKATRLCALGVMINILLLAFFKYTNFALESTSSLLISLGILIPFPHLEIALPLGISFFTFQKISYLVDIRRKIAKPAQNFGRYLLYILLFPQLLLGPIIRYHDIAHQFDKRTISPEDFLSGFWRLCIGLTRKMLIAGPLANIANFAFNASLGSNISPWFMWLGLYAYTMQLYYDFAGYCDIAVGIGRILGFKFPENFNAPYISQNMAEFWRRWHITLGAFMKEYLYIPLGGNRCSRARSILNNWIVFLVSGLWHGASLNFIFWGAWHGFWIMISKITKNKTPKKISFAQIPKIIATFLLVMIGWIFFRAPSFCDGIAYLKNLVFVNSIDQTLMNTAISTLTPQAITALIIATIFAFIPIFMPKAGLLEWQLKKTDSNLLITLRTIISITLFILSTLPLLTSSFNPFIYFRF